MFKYLLIGGIAYWYFFVRRCESKTILQYRHKPSNGTWHNTTVCTDSAANQIRSLESSGYEVIATRER